MAFGFDAIFAALASAYATGTGQTVPFVSGEAARHNHETQPPRFVFVHRGGLHEDPEKEETGGTAARSTEPLASVAVDVIRAECHGATDDIADQLWLNLCALLRTTYGGSVNLGAFGWLSQDERVASPVVWSVKWQEFRFKSVVPSTLHSTSTVTVETTGHDVHIAPSLTTSPLPPSCGHNVDPPE